MNTTAKRLRTAWGTPIPYAMTLRTSPAKPSGDLLWKSRVSENQAFIGIADGVAAAALPPGQIDNEAALRRTRR
ncbi:hypothetical protein [Nonomuraea sp. NPDC049141]|uniref:hypothetical protein n=1 Tax=unclassified Nonomuraea TaxID=2593643 RepID=UPI0033D40E08